MAGEVPLRWDRDAPVGAIAMELKLEFSDPDEIVRELLEPGGEEAVFYSVHVLSAVNHSQ